MIFSWLDGAPATKFGESLAQFFLENMPHDPNLGRMSEKKFAAKTTAVLDRLGQQIDAFKSKNKLNVYKKAKVGNAFKWALKDSGHELEYIDKLTDWVVARL